jgi:protocatechuate 3,4-dioxygenase beta subunit
MRFRLLAAGIVLAALTASAGAAPRAMQRAMRRSAAQDAGQGTLGGEVLGTDGKAVAGARVTLQASDGRLPKTTETNGQGHFWFPSLARGLYDVRAYSKGRVSEWRKNVWVDRGKQTNVTLRLRSNKPAQSKSPAAPAKP